MYRGLIQSVCILAVLTLNACSSLEQTEQEAIKSIQQLLEKQKAGNVEQPLKIRYTVKRKAMKGEKYPILLEYISELDADTLQVLFQPSEDLEIVSGNTRKVFKKMVAGEKRTQRIVVRPLEEGVFRLDLYALMKGGETEVAEHQIILVAAGQPVLSKAKQETLLP